MFVGFKNEDPIPEDLDERIRQKKALFNIFATKQKERKQRDLEKMNKSRENPENFLENDTVYERKRNTLKHQERYREIKVVDNREANIIDENGRKVHKTKLKRKRKVR